MLYESVGAHCRTLTSLDLTETDRQGADTSLRCRVTKTVSYACGIRSLVSLFKQLLLPASCLFWVNVLCTFHRQIYVAIVIDGVSSAVIAIGFPVFVSLLLPFWCRLCSQIHAFVHHWVRPSSSSQTGVWQTWFRSVLVIIGNVFQIHVSAKLPISLTLIWAILVFCTKNSRGFAYFDKVGDHPKILSS